MSDKDKFSSLISQINSLEIKLPEVKYAYIVPRDSELIMKMVFENLTYATLKYENVLNLTPEEKSIRLTIINDICEDPSRIEFIFNDENFHDAREIQAMYQLFYIQAKEVKEWVENPKLEKNYTVRTTPIYTYDKSRDNQIKLNFLDNNRLRIVSNYQDLANQKGMPI